MKRLVTCASLLALTACHNWDSEFSLRVLNGFVDGGTDAGGIDAGLVDAGGADAGGVDAGGVDAGCHPLCLMYAVEGGASMRGFVSLADGGFLGTGRKYLTASAGQVVTVSESGGAAVALGPTWSGDVEPHNIAGTSPDDFLLTTRVDIFTEVNGVLGSAGDDCGFPQTQWWGVTSLSPAEAWLSGTGGALCHWTRDAGFAPDLSLAQAFTDAGAASPDLYGQVVFKTEGFFVGAEGALLHTPADAGPPELVFLGGFDFSAADGLAPDDVFAVGTAGSTARYHAGKWVQLPGVSGSPDLYAVHVSQPGEAWAVGAGATLAHFTASGSWELITVPNLEAESTSYAFKGVSSHGAADLLISGTRTGPDGGELGFAWVYRR